MHVEHGRGEFFGGDAELRARVGGAGRFENIDAQQQISAAVGDGTGRWVFRTTGILPVSATLNS